MFPLFKKKKKKQEAILKALKDDSWDVADIWMFIDTEQ